MKRRENKQKRNTLEEIVALFHNAKDRGGSACHDDFYEILPTKNPQETYQTNSNQEITISIRNDPI